MNRSDSTGGRQQAPPRPRLHPGTLQTFMRGRVPGQLIIQITDRCNAACPQCDMRLSSPFERSTLDRALAERCIDHAAASGVVAVSITGGEPLLYLKDVTALLRRAADAGILLTRTGTNGFLLTNSESAGFESRVSRLVDALVDAHVYTFWISIDSADAATHERMRGLPGVIAGIRKALPLFHRAGLYPAVNLGINRNLLGPECPRFERSEDTYDFFRRGFRRFYDVVIDLGFTIANACYPMSAGGAGQEELNPVYQATARSSIVDFTREERVAVYQALHDTIPEYRGRIRIFSPRTSLAALVRQHTDGIPAAAPCRGGVDYFFVDARRGHAFPCGYRGHEDLGPYWEMDLTAQTSPARCQKCDWECWRDPSELSSVGLLAAHRPLEFIRRLSTDYSTLATWFEDLRYIAACGYFSARVPPDYARLARFAQRRLRLPTSPTAASVGASM